MSVSNNMYKGKVVSEILPKALNHVHSSLEKLATRSVDFLDAHFFNLSPDDLNRSCPVGSKGTFEKLNRRRLPYVLQAGNSAVMGALSYIGSAVTLGLAVSHLARMAGHAFAGDEILTNKHYLDSLACLGATILQTEATHFLIPFARETWERYTGLREKTDKYAIENGLKTSSVN